MTKNKILILSRGLPYPFIGGDFIILRDMMNALKDYQNIDLYFLKRPYDDLSKIELVKELGFKDIFYKNIEPKINFRCIFDWVFKKRSYIFNRFYSKEYSKRLLELIKTDNYNTILCLTHYMYINIFLNKELQDEIKKRNIKCILGLHVLEHKVLDKINNNHLFIKREKNLLKEMEFLFIEKSDRTFSVGKEECNYLKETLPQLEEKIHLLEIIPDINKYSYSSPDKEEKNSIYYAGSYSWAPNIDALKYFINEIFPLILEKNKKVKFYIVGANASKEIKKLHNGENIFFIGKVDDIFSEIQKYSVLVAPLRIGGGTRIKLLEALSWGKAIVTTSTGAEGIDLHGENPLIIADEPEIFAQKVIDLLENDYDRIRLKENARNFAQKYYKVEKFTKNLLDILRLER